MKTNQMSVNHEIKLRQTLDTNTGRMIFDIITAVFYCISIQTSRTLQRVGKANQYGYLMLDGRLRSKAIGILIRQATFFMDNRLLLS